jgi:hypothetical protein
LDEQRPARTRSDSGARGAMISASVDIGCDDRESPSIGADQLRRDVQANADSLTPHRIDSESTGAIASASVGPHESAIGWSREEAGVAEMAASPADQVGA